MLHKTKFLTALLCSILITAVNVEAQLIRPKFRSQYSLHKKHTLNKKTDRGVVLVAGVGVTVLNSDNRGHNFGDDGVHPLGNNGFGQNYNAGILYKFSPYWGVMGNVEFNRFNAVEDKVEHSNELAFRSQTLQASGSIVVNLIDRYRGYNFHRKGAFIVPYVKVGFGAASYKAYSYRENDEGKEIRQSNLRGYPALAAIVPVGAGLSFQCSRAVSIAPEMNFTFTSTDYLDNLPDKAGFTGENDHFINTSVKILYTPDQRSHRVLKKRKRLRILYN